MRHNNRQRKKLRIGEYTEMAFRASADVSGLDEAKKDAFIDAYLEEAIEANGLLCAATLDDGFWTFVVSGQPRGSVTEEQRGAVTAWLEKRSELKGLKVSGLIDANHGSVEA